MRKTFWILFLFNCINLQAQVWSPDGIQLAFFYIHDIEDIYLVNVDGTGFEILDGHPERDFMPDWSPDGKEIIFTSIRDGHHQQYQINLEERVAKRLIVSDHEDIDGHYSPEGDKIVFSSDRDGNSDLYVYDRGSGRITTLTKTEEYEYTPRWSPDGSRILFKRAKEEFGPSDLYVLDLSSFETEQITAGNQGEFHQNWSPDGKSLCYVQVTDGTFELHTMDLTTKEKKVLVRKEGFQVFAPSWSPDGKLIAFTRDVSEGQQVGYPALYVVDMYGRERMVTAENSFNSK